MSNKIMQKKIDVRGFHALAMWLWPNRSGKRILRWVIALGMLASGVAIADVYLRNLFPFLDFTGFSGTYSNTGSVDLSGPFFQSLGTNGRTCGTCHQPSNAFGLSAADAQFRYFITRGQDPLFAQIDGSTCPTGPINNSLVLNNGLIRIGLTVPPNSTDASAPQYTITAVQDPYGCALTTDSQGVQTVSVYRRPLPTTNLGFLSAVMFDGRESLAFPLNNGQTFPANLNTDLTQQAIDATLIHAQAGQAPTATQLSDIVDFELALNSAQLFDFAAGDLSKKAQGGAQFLSTQPYYPGINDSLGADPQGKPFTPDVFTIYCVLPELPESAASFHCARRADLQHATPDHQQRPRTNHRHSADCGNLHHLPRYV